MKRPKVSVIITTCNRSKLAQRAIRSVLKQDYSNFDLHIVDDASEDDTREVLDRIIKANDKVFYWRHDTRRGLSAARNTGLTQSKGEYIAFLDDDDVYKPDCISKRIALLQQLSKEQYKRLGVIYCGNEVHIPHENRIILDMPKIQGNIRKYMMKNDVVFPARPSTLLFPRKVLEQIGGFDKHILSSVDHDIWTNLAANGFDARAVEETLVIVYQIKHKTSMVSNTKPRIQGVESFLKKWTPTYQKWYGERRAKKFIIRYRTDVLGKLAGKKFAEGRLLEAWYLTSHVVKQNVLFPLEMIRLMGHYIRYLVRLCIPKRLIAIIRGEQ